MRRLILALLILAPGCAVQERAIPKTVALEAGTSVRHEAGESPTQVNSVVVKLLWELRK